MKREKLEAEAEVLNDLIAEDDTNDAAVDRLTDVYELLGTYGRRMAETRASILSGLGFTPQAAVAY